MIVVDSQHLIYGLYLGGKTVVFLGPETIRKTELCLRNLNIKLGNDDGALALYGFGSDNKSKDRYYLIWNDDTYWFRIENTGYVTYGEPGIQWPTLY